MCYLRLTTYQRQIYQGNLKILATQVKTSFHSLQNCVQFKRYQTTEQYGPTCDPMMCRYFHTTTKFIDQAVSSGGLIVVNCVMGWSRFQTKNHHLS